MATCRDYDLYGYCEHGYPIYHVWWDRDNDFDYRCGEYDECECPKCRGKAYSPIRVVNMR